MAAASTTGYSIVDSSALEVLREQLNGNYVALHAAALYIILQAGGAAFWLLLFVLPQSAERIQIVSLYHQHKWLLLLTGLTVYLTYGLVLVAMGFGLALV